LGYLSSTFDWNAIFTINIPIGIFTVILAFLILRGRQQEHENDQDGGQSLQFWLIIRGLGLGCVSTPLQTLAFSVVNKRAVAKASSLESITRQVFGQSVSAF
jgi:predicted MFS family arabinose efflux permease